MKHSACYFVILLTVILCCSSCGSRKESGPAAEEIKEYSVEEARAEAKAAEVKAPALSKTKPQEKAPSGSGQPEAGTSSKAKNQGTAPAEYSIRLAEWENVQWEKYKSPYFTIEIPKGWKVSWDGNAEHLMWQASDPGNSMIGLYNIDHLSAAKSRQMSYYLGLGMYLEEGSVPEFFEKMYADTTDYFTVKNSCVPADRAAIQSLRRDKAIWDYQSLYAVFAENGVMGEGIYSAVIMEAPDIILAGGYNYAMWEINGVFAEFAPLGELVNWQPVLSHIMQSFNYTDYYIREWRMRLGIGGQPSSPANDTGSVLEAFEERSRRDTILQEKRSDMIGEYERVYDNDTQNIYRAYSGFMDDIGTDQTRFTPITDSQYAEGYAGWIDR